VVLAPPSKPSVNVPEDSGSTNYKKSASGPSVNVPADSGSTKDKKPASTSGVQKQITNKKGKEINPSSIGIQKIREYLEEAKNAGKLSVKDTSEYIKAMDGFKASTGDKQAKAKHFKTLRGIYKQN
jgi:hypothetical protein